MKSEITEYNFPEADFLKQEIRLIRLKKNLTYTTEKPHRHNYFELFYFIKGGGDHAVDFSRHKIFGKSLHIVLPGTLHLVERAPDSSGWVILFTKSFLYSIMDFSPYKHQRLWNTKPVYQLTDPENEFIGLAIKQLNTELENKQAMQTKAISCLLRMIFILMFRQANGKENDDLKDHEATQRFFALLEDNFLKKTKAEDYAQKLNYSLKTLNQKLRSANCQTVLKNITERKVLEAKRLLAYSDWSVKEIAYHLQFEDPDYFGKVFKKETGENPHQFRTSNK